MNSNSVITSKLYSVSTIKQLIDINGELSNFKVNFKVVSKEGLPFEMLIINQSTLDTVEQPEFKMVSDGEISGEVVSDKNVYQNYFLILRASEPVDVIVDLEVTPLSEYIQPYSEEVETQVDVETSSSPSLLASFDKRWLIALCVAMILFYYYYRQQKGSKSTAPVSNLGNMSLLDRFNSLRMG